MPQDKRLGIDLRLVQNYLQASTWKIKWVPGPQQLADTLTKEGADPTYLKWVLSHARYQLLKDDALHEKVNKAISRTQEELSDRQLTKEERTKERNHRKGAKHRARMEFLRNQMSLDKKPVYFTSTIDFATAVGLEALRKSSL